MPAMGRRETPSLNPCISAVIADIPSAYCPEVVRQRGRGAKDDWCLRHMQQTAISLRHVSFTMHREQDPRV